MISDYGLVDGATTVSLIFSSTIPQSVDIPIIDDDVVEVDESFTISLFIDPLSAALATTGSPSSAIATIVDNDGKFNVIPCVGGGEGVDVDMWV